MPKKYLIIRFSSIGDIVLTTPVIRCLKKQTGAEVHFLTKKPFRSLLEANPYVDKIYMIEKKVGEVMSELKKENYDGVIDLHQNLRTRQIKFGLSAQAYSFDKINFQKWLMVNMKINQLPSRHIVDRYMDTVKPLGVENDGEGLDYFLPKADEAMEANISDKVPGIDFSKPFLTFAVGAAHQTKRPSEEMILEICRRTQLPVLLLGGPGEKEDGERIENEAKMPLKGSREGQIIATCGKLSLHESAFLIKKSLKVITPDTGMMHVAAAFKKEIIAIWGNTIPEFGMHAYYGNSTMQNTDFEVKNLSCRPCSKIGYKKCPKGHFKCMKEQSLEKIIEKINE